LFPNLSVSRVRKNDIREVKNTWIKSAQRRQIMFDQNTFTLLNETHHIDSRGWNNKKISKLWLYNLHYFDDLNSEGNINRLDWHYSIINRWIVENLPFQGNGWEPYPTSLRIVNWIKWGLNGNKMENHWLNSLEVQARLLTRNIETHLLGNHLIANAKALIFAGLYFEGKEAKKWYRKGIKILDSQINEQVLSDGGNFELSTMYHVIVLEDLLDLINIFRAYNTHCPKYLEKKALLMMSWLKTMCHPDGEISFFNDSALNLTPSVKEIEKYASRLGLDSLSFEIKSKNRIHNLVESGYTRVNLKDLVAIIDRAQIGPDYLPAHAHADTLSFELSLFGERVIVNSGTSTYGISRERQRQRGTESHSTVMIDNENSSEVWGGFRVAKRAKVFDLRDIDQAGKITLSASHDGYHRLKGMPTHKRKWEFSDNLIIINDQIDGKHKHNIEVIFPLHPKIKIDEVKKNEIILDLLGNKIKFSFDGQGFIEVKKSFYHPEFGISVENYKISYCLKENLPLNIISRISW
jgi:uncharacterized heparinase superfamily protein